MGIKIRRVGIHESCIPNPPFIYLLQNSASVKDAVDEEEQQEKLPGISDKIDGEFFQTIGTRIQIFPLFAGMIILGELTGEPLVFVKQKSD